MAIRQSGLCYTWTKLNLRLSHVNKTRRSLFEGGIYIFCQRDNENARWHTRHLEPISKCFPNCSWWRYYRAAYVILEQNSTYSGLGMSTSILFVSLSKRQRECLLTYQAPWAMSTRQGECPKLVTENMRLQNKLKQDSSNAAVGMNQVSNYLATKSWNTWNLLIDLILGSLGSLIFSVTSFGHSHRFSDKLWTLSLFEWQIVDILPLSQWQVVDILPITQWQVVDTLVFFSAINCEDFEIKAKIRVENQLFHTFHRAHRIPEAFLHDICRNSFSCDSPF